MTQNLWQTLFGRAGTSISQALSTSNHTNQYQLSTQNSQYLQQLYQQAPSQLWSHPRPAAPPPPRWMFNGEVVSLVEFADLVYGDTAKRTEFILRYSDK